MQAIYNHFDDKKDNRYSVNLEWCGHKEKRHVARFCGEWIGQDYDEKQAWILAQEHYDNHKIDNAINN